MKGTIIMINQNDWRLTNQMNYLFEKQLKHVYFQKHSESGEHEHCEFCNETICDEKNGVLYNRQLSLDL